MPLLKNKEFKVNHKNFFDDLKVKIMISAGGLFYAKLPEYLFTASSNLSGDRNITVEPVLKGVFKVSTTTLNVLERTIEGLMTDSIQPEIKEALVIRFNIQSDVSFAENDEGDIFPNAGFPGAEWHHHESDENEMYGGHHATQPADGGYGLIVGAQVLLKTEYTFGGAVKTEYSYSQNHGKCLNKWVAFKLPEHCKEIPYTEEAENFFNELLHGMAKLSQFIQKSTFSPQALLETIQASSNGDNLLGFSPKKSNKEKEIIINN